MEIGLNTDLLGLTFDEGLMEYDMFSWLSKTTDDKPNINTTQMSTTEQVHPGFRI